MKNYRLLTHGLIRTGARGRRRVPRAREVVLGGRVVTVREREAGRKGPLHSRRGRGRQHARYRRNGPVTVDGDVGPWLCAQLKANLESISLKYVDPSYSVRAAPSNAADTILCRVAQHAVHGALGGRDGLRGRHGEHALRRDPLRICEPGGGLRGHGAHFGIWCGRRASRPSTTTRTRAGRRHRVADGRLRRHVGRAVDDGGKTGHALPPCRAASKSSPLR